MSTLIIIPTYNEADNIKALVNKILGLSLRDTSILIIDDNSPDGTGKIADSLSKKYKYKINVIHRPGKLGLGSAYKDGFKEALTHGVQMVVTMDADLSHDPKEIPKIIKKLKKHDVVVGSRHIRGGKIVGFNIWRHLLSRGAQWLSTTVVGISVGDSTSAFRGYRSKVLKAVKPHTIKSEGYSFLIELIYRCQKKGFKITEIPITYINRTKGKSKISQAEILKALLTIFKLKFTP